MREWVKELRKNQNLTIGEAAKKCEVSKSYYEKIENGKEKSRPRGTAGGSQWNG